MSFIVEYKKILSNGYKKIIYKHDKISNKYDFIPFHHSFHDKWDIDFADLLVKNLLNYCYYENEIKILTTSHNIDELEKFLAKSVRDRLNRKTGNEKTDGLCGELLLDPILRIENFSYKTLLCRPYYQQLNAKAELKNYDALLFSENKNKIKLILGQVKTGDYKYCKEGIAKDLNTKYNNPYFGNAICYIADREFSRSSSTTLSNILSEINNISLSTDDTTIKNKKTCEYIKANNIDVEIPCLLFYDSANIYDESSKMKDKLFAEVNKLINYYKDKSFDISDFNYEIIFYIFPAKSINCLRKKIMEYKEEKLNG